MLFFLQKKVKNVFIRTDNGKSVKVVESYEFDVNKGFKLLELNIIPIDKYGENKKFYFVGKRVENIFIHKGTIVRKVFDIDYRGRFRFLNFEFTPIAKEKSPTVKRAFNVNFNNKIGLMDFEFLPVKFF